MALRCLALLGVAEQGDAKHGAARQGIPGAPPGGSFYDVDMEIKRAKPLSRGVTELMFIGDDEGDGTDAGRCKAGESLEDLPLVGLLAFWAVSGKGTVSRVAAGAGAAYIAWWNAFWLPRLRNK